MKDKFNWAVTLYLLSFLFPVLMLSNEEVIYGWEVALQAFTFSKNGVFATVDWASSFTIIAVISNPLVLISIILYYTKKGHPKLNLTLSLLSIITALFWFPYFFYIILEYFSFGYWTWLISIILMHLFIYQRYSKSKSEKS